MQPCFSHMMGLFLSGPLCLIEGGEIKGSLQTFWVPGVLICQMSCIFLIAPTFCKWKEDLLPMYISLTVVFNYSCCRFFLSMAPKLALPSSILSGC